MPVNVSLIHPREHVLSHDQLGDEVLHDDVDIHRYAYQEVLQEGDLAHALHLGSTEEQEGDLFLVGQTHPPHLHVGERHLLQQADVEDIADRLLIRTDS